MIKIKSLPLYHSSDHSSMCLIVQPICKARKLGKQLREWKIQRGIGALDQCQYLRTYPSPNQTIVNWPQVTVSVGLGKGQQLWTNQSEVSMLSANQVQLKIDSLRYSTHITIGRITSHDHFWTYFSKFFELSSIRTMDCVLELRRQEKLWKISAFNSTDFDSGMAR